MDEVYIISKKEINRRINAYTALIIFFLLSLILFLLNYVMEYFNIAIYIIFFLALSLFLSRMVVIRYFNSILKTDVKLNCDYITKSNMKYLIKDIKKITVKRTIKGHIREMKIELSNNKSTYVNNSITEIEDFLTKLKKYLPKAAIITTIYEPLDFDHSIFYPVLGIILGFISVNAVKIFFTFGTSYTKFFSYITPSFAFSLGLYFILYKPIYKRNEEKGKKGDYIWGGFFILGAVLIVILNII